LSGKFGPDSTNQGRRATFDFPPVDKDNAWACVAAMRTVAEKHSTNVACVALAYILARPFVTSVVIGAKRLDQLEQNLDAVHLELDADDLSRLDGVSELTPEYPGWMLARTAPTRMPAGMQVTPGAPAPTGHQAGSS
jgi:aryl-alcohol dehydrogenase-like predicted oxidoreductase